MKTYQIQINTNGIWTTVSNIGNFGLQREVDYWANQTGNPTRAIDYNGCVMAMAYPS
jgi:hypothetical protein